MYSGHACFLAVMNASLPSSCQHLVDLVLSDLQKESKPRPLGLNSCACSCDSRSVAAYGQAEETNTALHRVARCGNSNVFRDLLNVPECSFLIEEVSNRLGSDKLSDFKPREIANTAWGVAKAQISAPRLFASICSAALSIGLEHFRPMPGALQSAP